MAVCRLPPTIRPATAPGLDLTLTGVPGAEITPGYPNAVFAQDFHTDIKEPAVFGEVSYSPIDPLKLTARPALVPGEELLGRV